MTDSSAVGINLSFNDYYSTEFPFINRMKSASSWASGGDPSLIPLDANGYPTGMPPGNTSVYVEVGLDPLSAGNDNTYVLTYTGTATFSITGATIVSSQPGKIVFQYTRTDSNLTPIYVSGLDPNNQLDNMAIVRSDQVDLYNKGEIFNPEFISKISQFDTLRYMEWNATNTNETQNWSDRTTVNDATWQSTGASSVPIEVEVALANETKTNMWLNVPTQATDDYVRQMLKYVHDNLDPSLSVHLEYSNEVWNFSFEQAHYASAQADKLWGTDANGDGVIDPNDPAEHYGPGWLTYYGYRAAQVANIANQVFGADDNRLNNVLSTFTAYTGIEGYIFDGVSRANVGSVGSLFKDYAVATYFTGGLQGATAADQATILSWAKSGDAGMTAAFAALENGTGLSSSAYSLAGLLTTLAYQGGIAKKYGLNLVAYEGGVDFNTSTSVYGADASVVTDFLQRIQADPRMGDVYAQLVSGFTAVGGTLLNAYTDASNSVFGTLKSIYDPGTPEWNALIAAEQMADGRDPTTPTPTTPTPTTPTPTPTPITPTPTPTTPAPTPTTPAPTPTTPAPTPTTPAPTPTTPAPTPTTPAPTPITPTPTPTTPAPTPITPTPTPTTPAPTPITPTPTPTLTTPTLTTPTPTAPAPTPTPTTPAPTPTTPAPTPTTPAPTPTTPTPTPTLTTPTLTTPTPTAPAPTPTTPTPTPATTATVTTPTTNSSTTASSLSVLAPGTTDQANYVFASGVRTIRYVGTGMFTVVGNDLGDTITAGDGGSSLTGGAGSDTLTGGVGNDYLDGGAGADRMVGGAGDDTYVVDDYRDQVVELPGGGTDTVRTALHAYILPDNVENLTYTGNGAFQAIGNAQDNLITGGQGSNRLSGGAGNDTLIGGAGDDVLDGGTGADRMVGGAGNDIYFVDNPGDQVVEDPNGGTDTVYSAISYTLPDNVENLTLLSGATDGVGNALANVIVGNAADNHLSGGAGDDVLDGGAGNDVLDGGDGNDTLTGGPGADTLTGGGGADRFVFRVGDLDADPAKSDTITDFSRSDGDKIDLSAFNSSLPAAAKGAFTFIGTAAFDDHPGELRIDTSGPYEIVYGDLNGDGIADFAISVSKGSGTLIATDFVL